MLNDSHLATAIADRWKPTPVPSVSVQSLSKTFGAVQVLSDVTFEARAGEVTGLVGQNGSGKSTLIKILSGVYPADDGSVVEIDGRPVSNPVRPAELRSHGLAFVHQDLGLVGERTVLENIRIGQFDVRRYTRRIDWPSERTTAEATLARLHATIDCSQLVNTLHQGEKAVVAISRALQSLISGSGCIVFDESTRALPRELLPDFYDTVRRLAASGTAVVVVSHRLDEIVALTDRVTVLQDGRVVATRATAELTEGSLARLVLGREVELLEQRTPDGRAAARRANGTKSALRVRGLTTDALRAFDLDVEPGEVVGITGATGSGHAEIPYALAGVVPTASGEITIGGDKLVLPLRNPGEAIRAGIALVPEERAQDGLALALSAEANLTLPRVRRRGRLVLRRGWQNDEFQRAVDMLGITPPRQHRPVSTFSGGNQQKILLAKWLLNEPRVLLLHEPTQAVDIGARMDILRALRATAALGICIVFTSSEPQDLEAACDRVVVLRDGRIAAELESAMSAHAITDATYPSPAAAVSPGGVEPRRSL